MTLSLFDRVPYVPETKDERTNVNMSMEDRQRVVLVSKFIDRLVEEQANLDHARTISPDKQEMGQPGADDRMEVDTATVAAAPSALNEAQTNLITPSQRDVTTFAQQDKNTSPSEQEANTPPPVDSTPSTSSNQLTATNNIQDPPGSQIKSTDAMPEGSDEFLPPGLSMSHGTMAGRDPARFSGPYGSISNSIDSCEGNAQSDPLIIAQRAREILLPLVIQNAQLRSGSNTSFATSQLEASVPNLVDNKVCLSFASAMQSAQEQLKAREEHPKSLANPGSMSMKTSNSNDSQESGEISESEVTSEPQPPPLLPQLQSQPLEFGEIRRPTNSLPPPPRPASVQPIPIPTAPKAMRAPPRITRFDVMSPVAPMAQESIPEASRSTWKGKDKNVEPEEPIGSPSQKPHWPRRKTSTHSSFDEPSPSGTTNNSYSSRYGQSPDHRRSSFGTEGSPRSPTYATYPSAYRHENSSRRGGRSPEPSPPRPSRRASVLSNAQPGITPSTRLRSPRRSRSPNGRKRHASPDDRSYDKPYGHHHKRSRSNSSHHSDMPPRRSKTTPRQGLPSISTKDIHITPPRVVEPCDRVPGIWFLRGGLGGIGNNVFEFNINKEAAEEWGISDAINWDNRDKLRMGRRPNYKLSLKLLCLSAQAVKEVYEKFQNQGSTSPESIAKAISDCPHHWPCAGKLLVQLNVGEKLGKTWFPDSMVL
ncbi:hypothetical protein BD779DRAFT_1494053 [Infundibulicybe gibba]|nr:hypothetical protein BD779DRAFT_1494053 [Infundibulicybe gibba]